MKKYLYILTAFAAFILFKLNPFAKAGKKRAFVAYSEGLTNENDGKYEKAIESYHESLDKLQQRSHSNQPFARRILEKIRRLKWLIGLEKKMGV